MVIWTLPASSIRRMACSSTSIWSGGLEDPRLLRIEKNTSAADRRRGCPGFQIEHGRGLRAQQRKTCGNGILCCLCRTAIVSPALFQAGNTIRCALELLFFFMRGVRRVIGAMQSTVPSRMPSIMAVDQIRRAVADSSWRVCRSCRCDLRSG